MVVLAKFCAVWELSNLVMFHTSAMDIKIDNFKYLILLNDCTNEQAVPNRTLLPHCSNQPLGINSFGRTMPEVDLVQSQITENFKVSMWLWNGITFEGINQYVEPTLCAKNPNLMYSY